MDVWARDYGKCRDKARDVHLFCVCVILARAPLHFGSTRTVDMSQRTVLTYIVNKHDSSIFMATAVRLVLLLVHQKVCLSCTRSGSRGLVWRSPPLAFFARGGRLGAGLDTSPNIGYYLVAQTRPGEMGCQERRSLILHTYF